MIQGRISVVMPTTGRKDRAIACINQIFATTQGRDVEVICVVDVDWDSAQALSKMDSRVHVFYFDHYQSIAKCLNIGLKNTTGEFIVLLADDTWPTGDWCGVALRHMATFPDGVGLVGFNDGRIDGNIVGTHYMVHRKFILDYMGGCLGFEIFEYQCNDLLATDLAKRAGRYIWAKDSEVRHDHPSHGTRPDDENDARHRPFGEQDNQTYYRLKDANYPLDFLPAITE